MSLSAAMPPKGTPCFAGGKQGSVVIEFDDDLQPATVEVAYLVTDNGRNGKFAYMTSGDQLHVVSRSGFTIGPPNLEDPVAALANISRSIKAKISKAGHRTMVETLPTAAVFDWEPYTGEQRGKGNRRVQRGSTYGDVDLEEERFLTILTRMDLRKERRMQRRAEKLLFASGKPLYDPQARSQEAPLPVDTNLSSSADTGGVNPFLAMRASHVGRLAAAALSPSAIVLEEAEAAEKAKLEREQRRASWKGRLLDTSARLLRKLMSFVRPGEDAAIVDEVLDHYSAPRKGDLLSGRTRRAFAAKIISVAEDAEELAKLSATADQELYYAFLLQDSASKTKRLAVFRPDYRADGQKGRVGRTPTTHGAEAALPMHVELILDDESWSRGFSDAGAPPLRAWHEAHASMSLDEAMAVATNAAARPQARQLYQATVLRLSVMLPSAPPDNTDEPASPKATISATANTGRASTSSGSESPLTGHQALDDTSHAASSSTVRYSTRQRGPAEPGPAEGPASIATQHQPRAVVPVPARVESVLSNYGGVTDQHTGGSWGRNICGHMSTSRRGARDIVQAMQQPDELKDQIVAEARKVLASTGPVHIGAYKRLKEATTEVPWVSTRKHLPPNLFRASITHTHRQPDPLPARITGRHSNGRLARPLRLGRQ